MEAPGKSVRDLMGRVIHPLVFWLIVTLVLVYTLFLILRSAGVIEVTLLLLSVPVVAYLLVMGIFLFYLHRLNQDRNRLLANQVVQEGEKVKEFEKLTKELERYAKQLFDKDLELTLANRRLQQLEQAKSKFVSVTTHQLRTPLSAIKWTFHMLLRGSFGAVSDDQKEFLQKGFQSTERMIAIVNDLLNVDYIEADKSSYHFKLTNLVELINGVIFEFTNQVKSRQIELKFIQPVATIPPVNIDPVKVSMVLENLLDNALKYTRPNGKVTIYLKDDRLNSARNSLEVVVADTGVGIPAAERDKIFHRFFRASNAIRVHTDGSGLGLFIAKDIIKKHGGEIWFETKEGEGTAFHFTLLTGRP